MAITIQAENASNFLAELRILGIGSTSSAAPAPVSEIELREELRDWERGIKAIAEAAGFTLADDQPFDFDAMSEHIAGLRLDIAGLTDNLELANKRIATLEAGVPSEGKQPGKRARKKKDEPAPETDSGAPTEDDIPGDDWAAMPGVVYREEDTRTITAEDFAAADAKNAEKQADRKKAAKLAAGKVFEFPPGTRVTWDRETAKRFAVPDLAEQGFIVNTCDAPDGGPGFVVEHGGVQFQLPAALLTVVDPGKWDQDKEPGDDTPRPAPEAESPKIVRINPSAPPEVRAATKAIAEFEQLPPAVIEPRAQVYALLETGKIITGTVSKAFEGTSRVEIRDAQHGGYHVLEQGRLRSFRPTAAIELPPGLVPEGREAYDPAKHQPPVFVEGDRLVTVEERKELAEFAKGLGVVPARIQAQLEKLGRQDSKSLKLSDLPELRRLLEEEAASYVF